MIRNMCLLKPLFRRSVRSAPGAVPISPAASSATFAACDQMRPAQEETTTAAAARAAQEEAQRRSAKSQEASDDEMEPAKKRAKKAKQRARQDAGSEIDRARRLALLFLQALEVASANKLAHFLLGARAEAAWQMAGKTCNEALLAENLGLSQDLVLSLYFQVDRGRSPLPSTSRARALLRRGYRTMTADRRKVMCVSKQVRDVLASAVDTAEEEVTPFLPNPDPACLRDALDKLEHSLLDEDFRSVLAHCGLTYVLSTSTVIVTIREWGREGEAWFPPDELNGGEGRWEKMMPWEPRQADSLLTLQMILARFARMHAQRRGECVPRECKRGNSLVEHWGAVWTRWGAREGTGGPARADP